MKNWRRKTTLGALLSLWVGLLAGAAWLAGCAANEPFDPETLENARPVARFMAQPLEGEELNDTSYFRRTFNWSGTDRDGWVTEYHVSIRTDGDNPAPWDTTTVTDTTMTFLPDPTSGEASATFLIACRDNRGAMSDTVVQYVPMRNFPPVVNFQSDYEPLRNLQREFTYDGGGAVVDTTYWNWGPNTFRFTAFDLDGLDTMNDYYRYTLVDGGNPGLIFEIDDPAADPELGWVTMPFGEGDGSYEFEIFIHDALPGERTLTVSVQDEAGGDPRFQYSWDVREPRSSVLYVPDNSSSLGLGLYRGVMDDLYGEGNWDEYRFVFGFPDRAFVLLESMRKFEAVLWTDGGSTSDVAQAATVRDGALWQYVEPADDSVPGRLMMISRMVCAGGTAGPSGVFIGNILGINATTSAPVDQINSFSGHAALPQGGGAYLPSMTGNNNFGSGRGMNPLAGTEELYRMENCIRCYGTARPPFDPLVGVRRPERSTDPLASVVVFSVQLEYFDHGEVTDALTQILTDEMGVTVR